MPGLISPSTDSDIVGRVINGKFRVERCVGVGAWGAVYEAEQLSLGRAVAIKLLKPELSRDPRIEQRFQQEALAASRLNHPNTVSIIDFGQTEDGLLFIVMEFLRGTTLTQVIEAKLQLSMGKIADIVTQILRGLEEAHAAGIIHSDLKGDNIMVVARRSGHELVKVVDFGIARVVGLTDTGPVKDSNTVLGTPEYMSPEVITGENPTVASDIYSVGIVLYELLTGITPFSGRPTLETLAGHIREIPRPPSALMQRELPPLLEQATLKALEKEPANRFQSATEFINFIADTEAVPDAQFLCDGCGVESAVDFKFCPECGRQREVSAEAAEAVARLTTGKLQTWIGAANTVGVPRLSTTAEVVHGSALPLPLVGRDRHIDHVHDYMTRGSEVPGLEIVGARGAGKTTVLSEAIGRLEVTDKTVYLAEPDPTLLAAPLAPIRSVLASLLAMSVLPTREELAEALDDWNVPQPERLALLYLFGDSPMAALSPSTRWGNLVDGLVRAMAGLAAGNSAILVFENFDRYDAPSRAIVCELLGEPDRATPVIITRSGDVGDPLPAGLKRVELGPLTDDELGVLGEHLAGHGSDVMPSAELLIESQVRTPDHVEQLVRFVVEGGEAETAPAGLADLISGRVEHLPRNALLLCQYAAAFGSMAPRGVLGVAADGQLETEELDAALALLEARGIITANEDAVWFPQQLLRDVVYESTPADVRRTLHERVLDAVGGMDMPAIVFGHHCDRAGRDELACDWLVTAGDEAAALFDEPGASAAFERGLSAARRLLHREPTPDNEARYALMSIRLAESLGRRGQQTLARGVLQEAKRACSDMYWEVKVDHAAAHLSVMDSDHGRAAGLLRQAIGASLATGSVDAMLDLYLDLSAVLIVDGELEKARAELEEVINLITFGEGAAVSEGPTHFWSVLLRLARVDAMLGDGESAVAAARDAYRHAGRVEDRIAAARIDAFLATQYRDAGNRELEKRHLVLATEVARQHGDFTGEAQLLSNAAKPTVELRRVEP